MKITPEHLEILTATIRPLDTEERRRTYQLGKFPRADRVKDMDKRYRWDLLWDAIIEGKPANRWLCDNVYTYANDTHIDTALRSIVKPLGE